MGNIINTHVGASGIRRWNWIHYTYGYQGPVSISDKTFYREILLSSEFAKRTLDARRYLNWPMTFVNHVNYVYHKSAVHVLPLWARYGLSILNGFINDRDTSDVLGTGQVKHNAETIFSTMPKGIEIRKILPS